MIRPASRGDREGLLAITRSCDIFTAEEIGWARELIFGEVGIVTGREYQIEVLELDGTVAGYVCYGPAAEQESFDLYWIVVAPEFQGQRHGGELLGHVEARARQSGARRLLIETSEANLRARSFYAANHYTQVSQLKDFRRMRTGRVLFARELGT